jgi:hypothetical protein
MIMGSPFDTGTWDGVTGAYYTGYGSGEMMWLLLAIALCVVACWVGHRHESESFDKNGG